MTFTVKTALPSKSTHTSPSGHLETSGSVFTWIADPASTWYKLWIGYSHGTRIFTNWYKASEICSDGNCSVTTGAVFDAGAYEWYIKSWNDYGNTWSDGMSFSLAE
jgi:hypothetical protein